MGKQSSENDGMSKPPEERPAWQRVLIAIGIPLTALAIEMLFLKSLTPWLLFTAAVFVSSWLGGLKSGIIATVLSTALVWWFLVPPETSLETARTRAAASGDPAS